MQSGNLEINRGIPFYVVRKANDVLSSSGSSSEASRLIQTRFGRRFVLNVGLRYRLVSADKLSWKLMTHEAYNRYS